MIRTSIRLSLALAMLAPICGGCIATPQERFAEAVTHYLRRHPAVAIPKDNPVLEELLRRDPTLVAAVHQIAVDLVKGTPARRYRAMRELGQYGEDGARALRAFAEADANLRSNLIVPGDPQVRSLALAAQRGGSSGDRDAMAAIASIRVPALLNAINRYPVTPAADDDRRWEIIGYGVPAVKTLARAPLAKDRPASERALALELLALLDPPSAAAAGERLLAEWPKWDDSRDSLRLAAAAVDGLIEGRRSGAVATLLRLAAERSGRFRSEALRGVASIAAPDESTLAALTTLLHDPDVRVVEGAVMAGARLAPARIAVPALLLLADGAPRGTALAVLDVAADRPALAVALRPRLRELATGGHVDLQRAALHALLTSGAPEGTALVQAALGSKDPIVQLAALESLQRVTFRPELGVLSTAVITLLKDPSPEIRFAAVAVSGALGDGAAAPALIELATSARSIRTRAEAFVALGRLRSRPATGLSGVPLAVITETREVWIRAVRTMWVWGDDRVATFFREALRGSPADMAAQGYTLLAAGADHEDLEDALPSGLAPTMPPEIRTAAIATYAYRGGPLAAAMLRPLLRDEDPAIRAAVAAALGLVGGPNDVRALAAVVGSGRPLSRAGAVEALGRIGGRDAARLIRAALTDLTPDVRAAAAIGLGRLADGAEPGDLELLSVTSERDPSDRVAVAAAQAWAQRWTGGVSTDVWTRLAADQGRHTGFARRLAAAHALRRAGQPDVAAAVAAELRLQLDAADNAPRALALAADLVLVDPGAAAAAYAKARALATLEVDAIDAWTGLADVAAAEGDLQAVEAAVAGLRVAIGRPVDLPRLALRSTALGDVMTKPELRAALRGYVRHPALGRSALDQFKGPGVVHLTSGRRLSGEILGWVDDKLAVKTAGGRVYIPRGEISHVKLP